MYQNEDIATVRKTKQDYINEVEELKKTVSELEKKCELCNSYEIENIELKKQVETLEKEKKKLKDRIFSLRTKIAIAGLMGVDIQE